MNLLAGLDRQLREADEAVRRQTERLGALLELGMALSTTREVDEVLSLAITRLEMLVRADAATLFMRDVERGELWSRVLEGSGALKEIRIPETVGIAGHVTRTGQTAVVEDAYADARFHAGVDRRSGLRTGALIAAPLRRRNGEILGVVEVVYREPRTFSDEDCSLVEAVCAQVGGVLENVLLIDQLRRRNEELSRAKGELSSALSELDLLYALEKASASAEHQSDLLDQILERTAEALESSAASILLSEKAGGQLFFRSARGERTERIRTYSLKPGQGIAGQVALTGRAIRISKAERSPHYDPTIAQDLDVKLEAVLCVAIRVGEEIYGALELFNKPSGYDEDDERLATLLAGQTGRAILLRRAREEEGRKGRLAAIGQMLSGVMHDLRTPLMIIQGYAQLAASESDPDARARNVEVIEQQLQQIDAMTNETLAFARGDAALLLRTVHLNFFFDEVERFLRADLERTKVRLEVVVGYGGTARLDENKIKRAIYNLARNAAQAMPAGGLFRVRVERKGDELEIACEDDGPGIPEEIHGRLFESFVSAGKSDGTGLGLAIVSKIAEEHGGTVGCESVPGKGTCFTLRIPLEPRGE